MIPSIWYDNLPNAALESFLYAKPVITGNMGSLTELVTDGYNGYLIDPHNPDELAEKIRLLDDDDRVRTMGKNSHRLLEEKFSKEKHLEELMKVFQKVMSR